MDMMKVTARWEGWPGAPGYSNFFFAGGGGAVSDAPQVAERVREAFNAIRGELPDPVTIQVQREVEIVDSDSGMVQGYEDVGEIDPVDGDSAISYSGPAGAVVNWRTADLRNGRRIRGRTFLVPLAGAFSNGSLDSSSIAVLNNFGEILTSWDFDSEFGVWSRPDPSTGTGGVFATATGFNVPDLTAVLRSRRD